MQSPNGVAHSPDRREREGKKKSPSFPTLGIGAYATKRWTPCARGTPPRSDDSNAPRVRRGRRTVQLTDDQQQQLMSEARERRRRGKRQAERIATEAQSSRAVEDGSGAESHEGLVGGGSLGGWGVQVDGHGPAGGGHEGEDASVV